MINENVYFLKTSFFCWCKVFHNNIIIFTQSKFFQFDTAISFLLFFYTSGKFGFFKRKIKTTTRSFMVCYLKVNFFLFRFFDILAGFTYEPKKHPEKLRESKWNIKPKNWVIFRRFSNIWITEKISGKDSKFVIEITLKIKSSLYKLTPFNLLFLVTKEHKFFFGPKTKEINKRKGVNTSYMHIILPKCIDSKS